METINIRKIAAQDQSDFLAMSLEFYASEAVLHEIDPRFHERAFAELMSDSPYLDGYFLESDGKTVGYALLMKSYSREAGGPMVWVDELYVRPAYQGQGIGSAFFAWLEQQVPAARYRLEVEPENTRAAALYHRKGYVPLPYTQMIKDKNED